MTTKNEELKNLVRAVIEDAYVMSLGTADKGGVWVADLIYVSDEDLNLYWISMPNARHSRAIEQNNKVACTITANSTTNKERALQIEGIVERINGPLFECEKKLEAKRGLPLPKAAGEILNKGHFWYVLKPKKLELIHSESFGYERQSVDM
ncbi:MAG: pyridoxamine 5'-phosphate oxidase family protein [bacterium]|nr:pyridoxamine 5'-phosphate oxidase family protein [bacterium]